MAMTASATLTAFARQLGDLRVVVASPFARALAKIVGLVVTPTTLRVVDELLAARRR